MGLRKKINNPEYMAKFYTNNKYLYKDDVYEIKEWTFDQPHLPAVPEILIIFCLHSCYYDIESTKECLNRFFKYRAEFTEFFCNRNPKACEMQDHLRIAAYVLLPERTKNNYDVMFCRLLNLDAEDFHLLTQIKLFDMSASLQVFQRGLSDGFIAVVDCSSAAFAHLFRVNLFVIRKYFTYIQESLPIRLKAIHIVNVNYTVKRLVSFVRIVIKKEYWNMIHFHNTRETLYQYIDKYILPQEMGGKAGKIEELHGI